ncbi:MAG: purine-cytosine permease family protein [Vulcanimicrobiaceae bacterium]
MNDRVYREQVLVVEPTGIEPVTRAQRHGSPRDLFGMWFSANAEIATWMVGVFITALYGTDLRSAAIGIVIGNLAGFGLLGILATFGPQYGVPQMVASRLAFGMLGNTGPATLSLLAGVGWFAINTVFGAYALQTIAGWPYLAGLGAMLLLQIILAVYGYNLIRLFETTSVVLLAIGFIVLGIATLPHAGWNAPFNAHAPMAAGGALAGFIFAGALAFSYATGWVPCAADYSRYLPHSSNPRAVWWYSFLGCAVPCIALEIMGAATVTAAHHVNFSTTVPTQAISALLGPGIMGKLVLATVVLGTLTANCMNLYSGALAALVAFRIRISRASAAFAVGIIGAAIATGGGHPRSTAEFYTNFLLLLSYWASPWAGVVFADWLAHRREDRNPDDVPAWGFGTLAWIVGLLASLPFWNQAWFVGPVARAQPQIGDLSYYVGFIIAALCTYAFARIRKGYSIHVTG